VVDGEKDPRAKAGEQIYRVCFNGGRSKTESKGRVRDSLQRRVGEDPSVTRVPESVHRTLERIHELAVVAPQEGEAIKRNGRRETSEEYGKRKHRVASPNSSV